MEPSTRNRGVRPRAENPPHTITHWRPLLKVGRRRCGAYRSPFRRQTRGKLASRTTNELSSVKSTEAHSAVLHRRAVAHTRRLATFLADRKGFFAATRERNPIARTALHTVEADTEPLLGPPDAWERVVLTISVRAATEENSLSSIARLRLRSSRSVNFLGRPRLSTLARAAATRMAFAA
ncbi:hypothetical protein I4F81_004107 [Pyropia yezoensis]|uniref:Uncharacterized protein n=1 Tax=Pyropia yezoensis TaxID=2788 RepID=A0ACC3BV78_PYRYE|nr:hypothetical protein I4F81_004107 [Neopyropia yezoensis]